MIRPLFIVAVMILPLLLITTIQAHAQNVTLTRDQVKCIISAVYKINAFDVLSMSANGGKAGSFIMSTPNLVNDTEHVENCIINGG
jgi:hypothetical protein